MDKKTLIIVIISTAIAGFLGAYTASVFVFSKHPELRHAPFLTKNHYIQSDFDDIFDDFEKSLSEQEEFNKKIDDKLNFIEKRPISTFTIVKNNELKFIETKDAYKITINLKPFNEDPKNVDVKADDNTVIISAKYESKNKDKYSSSQFYQEFELPSEIDEVNIKKEKQGHLLIITLPKEMDKD